jgi:hypothetical protein
MRPLSGLTSKASRVQEWEVAGGVKVSAPENGPRSGAPWAAVA